MMAMLVASAIPFIVILPSVMFALLTPIPNTTEVKIKLLGLL